MNEKNFGLGGGTGMKFGMMIESVQATSMLSSMSVHLSVCLCKRFE